jgi:hypothetical protein
MVNWRKFRLQLAPLSFLISLLFLIGGTMGFFGPNPRLGSVYFALGLTGTIMTFRDTWFPRSRP